MEQRFVESFNRRLRSKCLNRIDWTGLLEARVVIGPFKDEHNRCQPHSARATRPRPSPPDPRQHPPATIPILDIASSSIPLPWAHRRWEQQATAASGDGGAQIL
ncbi:integrase core domain-containing protein [Nocardia amikacinitolerans]|uniref:integrase core domain-containing protein n=1 Tax=Nocardia amikacinitolerans TaxID=756689 RepID=UPI003558DCBA